MLPFSLDDLKTLTEELDSWRVRLDERLPLLRRWDGRLRRDLETEAVAASTSMEGVPVTVDEVRRILAGDRPSEVEPEAADLVMGYRDAMGFAARRADDVGFRWNRELVIALHDRVLAGKFGLGAGRFRTGPTFIVNSASHEVVFTPPDHAVVPVLVDEACMRMEESDMHPGVAAGWIHAAIACIHPFADGNGRIARVLSSLAMYRGGFKRPEFTSLEEWWGRHLRDYYASFACFGDIFDAEADPTPFLKAHLEAQLHQVRALDLREQVEERIWAATESVAEQAGLQPRVANALWDAFFDREISSRYYRPLADVSAATAANDLTACVAAGLLAPIGGGRSRRYVDGPRLYEMIGRELGLEVSGGPVEARAQIVERLSRGRS